jgi:septum formation topological specificity factor MinE/5-methylcytosine-specific restriction endonuclease McrA
MISSLERSAEISRFRCHDAEPALRPERPRASLLGTSRALRAGARSSAAFVAMKQLDRLMFLQGGLCFFCKEPLPAAEASVEHLLASANGGSNSEENCVACCKALNALLGHRSLKEKLQVVLNQKGQFKCPKAGASVSSIVTSEPPVLATSDDRLALVVADLHRRGSARPRKVATLRNTINAVFQKQLTEEEISSLIDQLQAQKVIVVSDTKIAYAFPQKDV